MYIHNEMLTLSESNRAKQLSPLFSALYCLKYNEPVLFSEQWHWRSGKLGSWSMERDPILAELWLLLITIFISPFLDEARYDFELPYYPHSFGYFC